MGCGGSGHKYYGDRTTIVRFMTSDSAKGHHKHLKVTVQWSYDGLATTGWWPTVFTLSWVHRNHTAAVKWLYSRRTIFYHIVASLKWPYDMINIVRRLWGGRTIWQISHGGRAVALWPLYDFLGTQGRVKTVWHLTVMAMPSNDPCVMTLWCYLWRGCGIAVSEKKKVVTSTKILRWPCDEPKPVTSPCCKRKHRKAFGLGN